MPVFGMVPIVELKFRQLPTGRCLFLHSAGLGRARHPNSNLRFRLHVSAEMDSAGDSMVTQRKRVRWKIT